MKSCFLKISKSFFNFSDADNRVFILLALAFYYTIFFAGLFLFKINLMKMQGIPVSFPCFADLRCITSAQDSIRRGYDPLINNPCDPSNRILNYPRIWQLLEKINVTQNHTLPIGIGLSVVFYLCVIIFLVPETNKHITILWIFLILSPAVTLAVERGNNDLIVFILLCLSLIGFKSRKELPNFLSYLLILFAAVLKLFPVFAFCSLFKEKKRTFLILSALLGFTFLLYILYTYNDLMLIGRAIPMGVKFAYGNMVIFDYFKQYVLGEMLNVRILSNMKICVWLFTFLFVILSFLCFSRKNNHSMYSDSRYITSFRIGASIFVGSFLLGNNWDYRLIFLLFTIPQLIRWEIENKGNLASKALWFTLISLWSISWLRIIKLPHHLGIVINEIFNWMLFAILLYLLVTSMPDWLKEPFTTKLFAVGNFKERKRLTDG
jgi:hypothetical protein